MKVYENLYCKIFVDTDMAIDLVKCNVATILAAQEKAFRTLSFEYGEIDINDNEDFDEHRRNNTQDGFLYWRYYLDVEPKVGVDQIVYIMRISILLIGLRSSGFKALPACDFEGELPSE